MSKVVFAALQYEYGQQQSGYSHEYLNLFQAMKRMVDIEVVFFPIDVRVAAVGAVSANQELLAFVAEQQPDIVFTVLFEDEIFPETIRAITASGVKTVNWFCDDTWRFDIFSKYRAKDYSLSVTTDGGAVRKYKRLRLPVVLSQWAANTEMYHPASVVQKNVPPISFVGRRYGTRTRYIAALNKAGLNAAAYGSGWGGGRITTERMIELFSSQSINLNFTATPYADWFSRVKLLVKPFVYRKDNKISLGITGVLDRAKHAIATQRRQIKARIFEIPACGGFLLTEYAPGVERYFNIGTEIETFQTSSELVEKCRYYVAHPDEQQVIARRGYERVVRDHTYEQRFRDIFSALLD